MGHRIRSWAITMERRKGKTYPETFRGPRRTSDWGRSPRFPGGRDWGSGTAAWAWGRVRATKWAGPAEDSFPPPLFGRRGSKKKKMPFWLLLGDLPFFSIIIFSLLVSLNTAGFSRDSFSSRLHLMSIKKKVIVNCYSQEHWMYFWCKRS